MRSECLSISAGNDQRDTYREAWVLRAIYSEWDDDLELPSRLLGLCGVHLFGLLVCMGTALTFVILEANSNPPRSMLEMAVLAGPSAAILCLLGVLPLTSDRRFMFRHTWAFLNLLSLIFMITIFTVCVWGDYSLWIYRRWRRPLTNYNVVSGIVAIWILVIPTLAMLPPIGTAVWASRYKSLHWSKYFYTSVIFAGLMVALAVFATCREYLSTFTPLILGSLLLSACFVSGAVVSAAIVLYSRGTYVLPTGAVGSIRDERRLFWIAQLVMLAIMLVAFFYSISLGLPELQILAGVPFISATMTLIAAIALDGIGKTNSPKHTLVAKLCLLVIWMLLATNLFHSFFSIVAAAPEPMKRGIILWSSGSAGGVACVLWLGLITSRLWGRFIAACLQFTGIMIAACGMLFVFAPWTGTYHTSTEILIASCIITLVFTSIWFLATRWLRLCGWRFHVT